MTMIPRMHATMPQLSRRRAVALLLATAAAPLVPSIAQSQDRMSDFQLAPGVIIDRARNRAYIMTPDNRIAAIDLGQGSELWRSADGTLPLAVEGDTLLCQLATGDNNLQLVSLNISDGRGQPAATVPLPAGVKAYVSNTRASTFSVQARVAGGEAVVEWEYTQRPWLGRSPHPLEVHPGEPIVDRDPARGGRLGGPPPDTAGQDIAGSDVVNGAARVNLRSGAVATAPLPPNSTLRVGRIQNLVASEKLAGLQGEQFLSADNSYVLNSELIADDAVWEKYRWTILDRGTGQRLGETREHFSSQPFTVVGSRLVYMTGPYTRSTDAGMTNEPVQLRAVELASGNVAWRQPVRDTAERRVPPQ
jgi:hypothetical protein